MDKDEVSEDACVIFLNLAQGPAILRAVANTSPPTTSKSLSGCLRATSVGVGEHDRTTSEALDESN